MRRQALSETSRVIQLPLRQEHPANAQSRLETMLRVAGKVCPSHDRGWPGTPWTKASSRKECTCDGSCQGLLPVQAEALTEALLQARRGGLGIVGNIGVGGGKTLTSLLLPSVLPCKRPVYLVPAKLRRKTLDQLPEIRRHWKVRQDLLIHSYEEVSTRPQLLAELGADLVIGDEAHRLARLQAARTRRVLRVAEQRPEIRWVWLSGTLNKRGPKDSSHLVELALGEGSYLPRDERELESWHAVLSSRGAPEASDWGLFRPLVQAWGERLERWEDSSTARLQLCREALEKRTRLTPGVVTLQTLSCSASILLRKVQKQASPVLQEASRDLQATGLIPESGGAQVVSEFELTRVAETIGMGFVYRWCWERTRAGEPDRDWMNSRSFWAAELGEYLVIGGQGQRAGVDTPGQVARIAETEPGRLPRQLVAAWRKWKEVKDRYRVAYLEDRPGGGEELIPVEPVWLTKEVVDWMEEDLAIPGTILWYHHRAVAAELKARGLRVFLRGDQPKNDGSSCALSESSHGEGFDLESFGRMVIPCPVPSGSQLEQLIGRIHRPGQELDEVEVDIWTHLPRLEDSLARAKADAQYLHYSGTPQRLIVGTWV